MTLTGNVIDVYFDCDSLDESVDIVNLIFDKGVSRGSSIFHNSKQLRILAEDIDELRYMLNDTAKKFNSHITKGLSKISIYIPIHNNRNRDAYNHANNQDNIDESIHDLYRLLTMISDMLYNNNIRLHNAFFSSNELVLIIDNRDAARAYELLRSKVTSQ